jgi:uncharacterized membrane protein
MRAAKVPVSRWIGILVLGSYPFLMHATLIFMGSSTWGPLLVLAELALVAAIAMFQFKRRLGLVLLALGAGTVALVFRNASSDVIVAASGIPHAAVNAGLLIAFGSSLLQGRKALITLVSEKLHDGPVPPELVRYTRSVTFAWCCFFALQLLTSLLLLMFAPIAIWSLFVNVLTLPLVALMFLSEYAYRRLRFRGHRHRTILQIVEAFSDGDMLKPRAAGGPGQQ